jgi:hypothetical protein
MKKKIIKEIGFCHECPHCKILPDPDQHDWFCGDDVKVVCAVNNNIVERACRPYEAKKVEIPSTCPFTNEINF